MTTKDKLFFFKTFVILNNIEKNNINNNNMGNNGISNNIYLLISVPLSHFLISKFLLVDSCY
mgnify:CR=1 FL=1